MFNWIPRFFRKEWYQYLFAKARNPRFCSWPRRLLCRIREHPAGEIFYDCSEDATEPDHRCVECGDYI